MTCITCARFRLKSDNARLARAGFGACTRPGHDTGVYMSATFERECPWHKPAAADAIAARQAWIEKQRQERCATSKN